MLIDRKQWKRVGIHFSDYRWFNAVATRLLPGQCSVQTELNIVCVKEDEGDATKWVALPQIANNIVMIWVSEIKFEAKIQTLVQLLGEKPVSLLAGDFLKISCTCISVAKRNMIVI